jgi:microcystin-dependent protein
VAFTKITKDMNILVGLSDMPNADDGLSADLLKAKFDEAGISIKDYINNTLVEELMGENASESIGAKAISGVAGENIYAQISDLKNQLNETVVGALPDNSITSAKLQNNVITNEKLASDVSALLALLSNTSVPTGTILPFGGSVAPANAVLCDGSAVSRTTYAKLFSVIGTTYGVGDGSTTFHVPNLKGKIPVGLNSLESEFNYLGKSGGEKSHILSSLEMPSHSHTASGSAAGGHNHNVTLDYYTNNTTGGSIHYVHPTSGSGQVSKVTSAGGEHTHSISVGNSGGGSAHNNIQPYLTVNYIIIAM